MINEKDQKVIQDLFTENLVDPVTVVMYSQKESSLVLPDSYTCPHCKTTEGLLGELCELSDRLTLEIHDFVKDEEAAKAAGVDKIPAILLRGRKDYGVRYFGTPVGYEFTTLVEDIVDVSKGTTGLLEGTKKRLVEIDQDIHLQVFVTPNCPYCPKAVRLAHQMAVESDRILADMVESSEFPHLVQRYNVFGVPRIIVNEDHGFEGALPEPLFLLAVLSGAGLLTEEEKEQLEKMHEHDHGTGKGGVVQ
ncbi:MAG: protein disulfide oxidoreductase [Planctomycetota bacterium]|jgi:glutaredoxin-like protein